MDDGSIDDTVEIAESFSEVRCVRAETNQGKGETVRRGMLEAKLEAVLFTDVDLSTPISEASSLLEALEGGADIAIASRQRGGEKEVTRTLLRRWMGSAFRGLVRVLVLRGIRDTQCGFKMFRRDVARDVFPRGQISGWAFDVEILFIARRRGYRIVEVPVQWEESEESRLTIWSPIQMAFDLVRIRWYQLTGRYRGR